MQTARALHLGACRPAPLQLRQPCGKIGCKPQMPQRAVSTRASMAGSGAAEDPYQVLGIPRNADSVSIQRAYKKRLAEVKGRDDAAQQRIEAAHSAIMMASLTSRLQGGVAVEKEVLFADRARYFPWRPRLWMAAYDILAYAALAQALLLAWALLSPMTAGTQPVIWSAVAGAVGNIVKQNRLNPVPKGGPDGPPDENRQGGKNIMRGFLLAFMATFAGCILFYTLPDALASALGRVLPVAFYEGQSMLLALGSCVCNWLFTAFTR